VTAKPEAIRKLIGSGIAAGLALAVLASAARRRYEVRDNFYGMPESEMAA
jgi:hypothetical protein